MLMNKASYNCDDYGLVSWQFLGLGVEGMPKQAEQAYCKCFESRLDQVTSAMASLIERPVGKGIEQEIEYEEQSVLIVPAVAKNSAMSVTSKVEDNILCIMIGPVIMLQPSMLTNPPANTSCILLNALYTFIIKQVCMPFGQLKAAKPRPGLAKAQVQRQQQPHLPVSVAPWQVMWSDYPRSLSKARQSLMIVNIGVAIMLLILKQIDAFKLMVKKKVPVYTFSANGTAVQIMVMTSMTVLFAPTLEVDMANVQVTLTKGCWGVMCYARIMRCSVWQQIHCLGQ